MECEVPLHNLIKSRDIVEIISRLSKGKASNSLDSLLSARDLLRLTPLHVASSVGDVNVVNLLIEYKANLNAIDSSGETSLHKAASRGQAAVCQVLVGALLEGGEQSCILDGNKQSAFFRAAHKGHMPVVELFLKCRMEYFTDILDGGFAAIRAGHPQVARMIVHALSKHTAVSTNNFLSFDERGDMRTVQQLQQAVLEWERTAKEVSDRNAALESIGTIAPRSSEEHAHSEDPRDREIAGIMHRIRQRSSADPARAGRARLINSTHLPQPIGERRQPLREQIVSLGAIKVDAIKAPSAGPEDPDFPSFVSPDVAPLLIDGPHRSDGPAADGRDDAAAACGPSTSPPPHVALAAAHAEVCGEGGGPVVFNFDIVMAPAPRGSAVDDDDDDDSEGSADRDWDDDEAVDSEGGTDECDHDADAGGVFEFNLCIDGEWVDDEDLEDCDDGGGGGESDCDVTGSASDDCAADP